jgi:predicted NAD/FAD-dependent oxidoreductase
VTVIVVGAGIAGLACARELVTAGLPVRILERGRVAGGRLASKRFDGRYADIGAAYFTADSPSFTEQTRDWQDRGLARPWTDTLQVYAGGKRSDPAAGPMRWSAPGGLRSLAEDLAQDLDVRLEHPVEQIGPGPVVDGERADAVVLAMPGPQALRLLAPGLDDLAAAARAQEWSPVLVAVLTYPERLWPDFGGAFVNDHPILATVCDDGDRRGDRAPVLVAHSTAAFARAHLKDPVSAAADLEGAVRDLLRLPRAIETRVHRWTYAQPAAGEGDCFADGPMVLAGDAFGKPRVQTAWESGRAAAAAVLDGSVTGLYSSER